MDAMELYLSEIEMMLRNELRTMYCYGRLRSIHVRPESTTPCGWDAEIGGSFSPSEQHRCDNVVLCFKRLYTLTPKLDFLVRNSSTRMDAEAECPGRVVASPLHARIRAEPTRRAVKRVGAAS